MIVQPSISRVISSGELYYCWLLSFWFNAPNFYISPVLASLVQGDVVICNTLEPLD